MGLFTIIAQLCSALGLSSAAGLNAYIPLLAIGILGRTGTIHLEGPYAALTTNTTLAVLGVLALVDFVADKIPAVDHATHAIGAIVHPIAGAIVFGSQTHAIGNIPPALALAAGLIVAGGFHATRAAVRPLSTATTAGIGNPIISLAEDLLSLVLSLLAVFVPILAFLLFLVLAFTLFKSWSAVRRGIARLFGGKQPQQTA